MEPFRTLKAVAAPLPLANIDTDQIIPARFMKKPRDAGYGPYLFHDLRFEPDGTERADFPLNSTPWREARVLVAGENFGCGSSREAAVYALYDYGIRCIIAPSFGDIFKSNAQKNGLLPIGLDADVVSDLRQRLEAAPGVEVHVDLAAQRVGAGAEQWCFAIDDLAKRCLLEGLDDIDLTRVHEPAIAAFERAHRARAPWTIPSEARFR